MLHTIIDIYDVLRTDIAYNAAYLAENKAAPFSTYPFDYLSRDGFYL